MSRLDQIQAVLDDNPSATAADLQVLLHEFDKRDINAVLAANLGGGSPGTQTVRQTAKLTLLPADLNSLASTPFELVPAPGASKVIVPYLLTLNYQPGDIGYTDLADVFFMAGPIFISGIAALTWFNSFNAGTTPGWVVKLVIFEHMMQEFMTFEDTADQPLLLSAALDAAGGGIDESQIAVANGGTGYSVDDVVVIAGGDANARARVASVNTGVVTAVDFKSSPDPPSVYTGNSAPFVASGTGYTTGTGVATSGAGNDDLTVDIGAVGDGDGSVDLVLQYTIIDLA